LRRLASVLVAVGDLLMAVGVSLVAVAVFSGGGR
jgi:hypothetical protein